MEKEFSPIESKKKIHSTRNVPCYFLTGFIGSLLALVILLYDNSDGNNYYPGVSLLISGIFLLSTTSTLYPSRYIEMCIYISLAFSFISGLIVISSGGSVITVFLVISDVLNLSISAFCGLFFPRNLCCINEYIYHDGKAVSFSFEQDIPDDTDIIAKVSDKCVFKSVVKKTIVYIMAGCIAFTLGMAMLATFISTGSSMNLAMHEIYYDTFGAEDAEEYNDDLKHWVSRLSWGVVPLLIASLFSMSVYCVRIQGMLILALVFSLISIPLIFIAVFVSNENLLVAEDDRLLLKQEMQAFVHYAEVLLLSCL